MVTEFVREARAIGATVRRSSGVELAGTLAELFQDDRSVVAVRGLESIAEKLRSRGFDVVMEEAGSKAAEALRGVDAGLGQALAGVAPSGTLVIGPGSGLEGLVSTLPPHYVALLAANAILPDLASALTKAAPLVSGAGSRVVLVTGPSRTSDIELTPVIGVHGPVSLDVVIVDA